MTPQSPRQPAEMARACIANLRMCQEMERSNAKYFTSSGMRIAGAACMEVSKAYASAITLIESEFASLLTVTP